MCGIFGYIGPRTNAAEIVLEGLKALEYRGYDSWGVAVVPTVILEGSRGDSIAPSSTGLQNDHHIVVKKKAGKIGSATVSDMPASSFAFGHTRWATHGGVTDTNAHPHLDCSGQIALIHNGIIENYEEIKRRLVKKGHKFISETDTEIAVHLIEEYTKTMPFTKAFQKAFNECEGLNAMIAIRLGERLMVAARNGSPLVVGFGAKENFLASDAAALLPYTKKVYFLDDHEMAIITDNKISFFETATGTNRHHRPQTLTWSVSQADLGKFAHFMIKEIHEQPGVVADIAASGAPSAKRLAGIIKKSYGAYMVGCGTASYAAIAGTYFFSKIAKRHVNWAIGSEFGYHLDFLTPKSVVIALSQSGETIDILESVKKAKEKKAKIVALVNVMGSSLYRLADDKILIGAGPEKAVASTKAFTGKLAHLILLAYTLAGKPEDGQRVLSLSVGAAKTILAPDNIHRIKALAKKIKGKEHIYVIGRGLSFPASLEVALKIKEISYIHAEGMASGELKHGTLALVEKGTPVIAFLPNDETYGANLAGAMEMKARGAMIIGFSHKPHGIFDVYLPVPDAAEATIIPNVMVGQLLAYYLTLERGFDPDKPRNLAKSVTVK